MTAPRFREEVMPMKNGGVPMAVLVRRFLTVKPTKITPPNFGRVPFLPVRRSGYRHFRGMNVCGFQPYIIISPSAQSTQHICAIISPTICNGTSPQGKFPNFFFEMWKGVTRPEKSYPQNPRRVGGFVVDNRTFPHRSRQLFVNVLFSE